MSPRLLYLKATIADAGVDGVQMFRCEPYNCTMRREACAQRWMEANDDNAVRRNGEPNKRLTYGLCAGCPIGKRHTEEVGEMKKCKRCGALKQRLSRANSFCRSCENKKANRQTSQKRERAPKEPVHAAPRAPKAKPSVDPLVEYITRVRAIQTLEAELVDFVQAHPEIVGQANEALGTLIEICEPIIAEPTSEAARRLIEGDGAGVVVSTT